MGEDAYDNLKKILLDLWNKKKNERQIDLRLYVKDDNERRIIIALPEDIETLKKSLEDLPKFLDDNPDLDEWILYENGKWIRLKDKG